MRISSDGYFHLHDSRVRTPGIHEDHLEPLPEREALSFLLSHAFRGPRRVARSLSPQHRSTLQRAMWTDSVNQRMSLIDRVWRDISEPTTAGDQADELQLLQIVLYGDQWAYPLYLKRDTVRVVPSGGLPLGELKRPRGTPRIDLRSA